MNQKERIAMSESLMKKAEIACHSAKTLLLDGDCDGAVNRAYYAMFDAAKAALIMSEKVSAESIGKTHSGLISAFNLYFVKDGLIDNDLGRLIGRAQTIRLIADYNTESVTSEEAMEVVTNANDFVSTIRSKFIPENISDDDYEGRP